MKDKNWDEILSLYIDGGLDEADCADVEEALAAKPELQAKYDNLLAVAQAL